MIGNKRVLDSLNFVPYFKFIFMKIKEQASNEFNKVVLI